MKLCLFILDGLVIGVLSAKLMCIGLNTKSLSINAMMECGISYNDTAS